MKRDKTAASDGRGEEGVEKLIVCEKNVRKLKARDCVSVTALGPTDVRKKKKRRSAAILIFI